MHLVNAVRTRLDCIPVVHEASAVIAAEYFNEVSSGQKAFALVTAGPGLTNALTGIAGAFLESREVLIVGGQVKSADLSRGNVRQRGIQEIDGVSMAAPVCVRAERLETAVDVTTLSGLLFQRRDTRPGPVYVEICLDAQGEKTSLGNTDYPLPDVSSDLENESERAAHQIIEILRESRRPILLLGGGVSFAAAQGILSPLASAGIPTMTTWNGFDRIPDDHPSFAGRPNTWGQRSANILISQSDCVVAIGTRLGLQQTGFNWEEWGPRAGEGVVVQVDIDERELRKGHPRVDFLMRADANMVLRHVVEADFPDYTDWWSQVRKVRELVPTIDPQNSCSDGYLSPYELIEQLSQKMSELDVLIPASSGSGQFVPMMTFASKSGQRVVTNKGLASMGYGLPAAFGAALSSRRRVVLVEGDGSFSQSIQELGSVAVHQLPVKIFLLDNDGYGSIRTTQKNYFGGAYLGCDRQTGLGFPDWRKLAAAFEIPAVQLDPGGLESSGAAQLFDAPGPAFFVVPVDPAQTYFPKVVSKIAADGGMVSEPIHRMYPPLSDEIERQIQIEPIREL